MIQREQCQRAEKEPRRQQRKLTFDTSARMNFDSGLTSQLVSRRNPDAIYNDVALELLSISEFESSEATVLLRDETSWFAGYSDFHAHSFDLVEDQLTGCSVDLSVERVILSNEDLDGRDSRQIVNCFGSLESKKL